MNLAAKNELVSEVLRIKKKHHVGTYGMYEILNELSAAYSVKIMREEP